MNATGNPIKVVSRMVGLSAHVIRIWEERYSAVVPKRTATNRRLYSQKEIERLKILRDLTRSGHSIGLVAGLPIDTLRKMAVESSSIRDRELQPHAPENETASILSACMTAIKSLDQAALESALQQGSVALGALGVVKNIIAPVTQSVGELWIEGTITAAHEHFATNIIRGFLWNAGKPYGNIQDAPTIIVGTPAGQLHELGALMAAAIASNLGWRVTYMGASLPAAEIAGAAIQSKAKAVALSLVFPEDDHSVVKELKLLRKLLPKEVSLIIGGRAVNAYSDTIATLGAKPVKDLSELSNTLQSLRKL